MLSPPFTIQNPRLCPNHSLSSLHYSTPITFTPQSPLLFSTTRHFRSKRSLQCRQSDYFQQRSFTPRQPPNEGSFGGALQPRVFVGHSIYKGKAALTVEPKAPEFTPLDSGAFKVSKEGFVLLQFAPAAGVRQYDWSRKQVFSLSVTEIGTLISLGARDSCEFFHDPFKGKSEEGKVRKVLKVEPLPDGTGHFFNLSVQNKLLNMDENIYIPITRAEYAVLISAFNECQKIKTGILRVMLPTGRCVVWRRVSMKHIIYRTSLGWHAFANSIKPEDTGRVNSANPRSGDFEWSR